MRFLIMAVLALAGCSGNRGPDEAAIHTRMEQLGQTGGAGTTSTWDYHDIQRGRMHDATAAEAQTGGIPLGTTVWPVHVSATHHFNAQATNVQRDLLFYQAGEDRHWVGVNAASGSTDRYR